MTTTKASTANPISEAREFTAAYTALLAAWDTAEVPPEDLAADVFTENGAGDRDGYLAWVAEYKRIVNATTIEQRRLVAEGNWYRRQANKHAITRLIRLRRISKVAARINRERSLAAAA